MHLFLLNFIQGLKLWKIHLKGKNACNAIQFNSKGRLQDVHLYLRPWQEMENKNVEGNQLCLSTTTIFIFTFNMRQYNIILNFV